MGRWNDSRMQIRYDESRLDPRLRQFFAAIVVLQNQIFTHLMSAHAGMPDKELERAAMRETVALLDQIFPDLKLSMPV